MLRSGKLASLAFVGIFPTVAYGGITSVRQIYDFSSMLVKTGVLKVKPAT